MTAEAVAAPLTVHEARRMLGEALKAVRVHKLNHEPARERLDVRATRRARAELGLAILGFVNASTLLAEAEDRVDPVRAAGKTHGGTLFMVAGSGHEQCEQAWCEYQQARRSGDLSAAAAARQRLHDELIAWHAALHEQRTLEDEELAEELRRRLDDSGRLHPGDAFPRPRSSRAAVVRQSRARERQDSIGRAEAGLSSPWIRTSRDRRPRPRR